MVSYSAGGTGQSELSLFLKDDETVWGAGRNDRGQLGQAPPGDVNPTPVLVSWLPTFSVGVESLKHGQFHNLLYTFDSYL